MTTYRRSPHERHALRVFLSGRIDGVLLGEAAGWRQEARDALHVAGFDVYDPTAVMVGAASYKATPNEVFTNDRWNLARSDVVLVNLDLPETIRTRDAPFFTIGEMFLAHAAGLPVITIGSCFDGRPGFDAIVTKSVRALDEALTYIVSTYGHHATRGEQATDRPEFPEEVHA